MSDPIVTSFDTVMAALVRGFDGWPLTSGETLRCTDQIFDPSAHSGLQLPILSLQEGSFTSQRWDAWLYVITWTIPGELVVSVNYADEGGAAIRRTLTDLHEACMSIGGLPVGEDGQVVRYSAETAYQLDEGKLTFLCDRAGPLLTSGQVQRFADRPTATVKLNFSLNFYMSVDRRKMHRAQVVALGFTPLDPARLYVPANWAPTSPPETTAGLGQFASAGPLEPASAGEAPDVARDPLAPTDPPTLAGADPAAVLQRLNVAPYAVTVAHSASTQLRCIATFADGHVQDVTAVATWATTDGTKATVTAGLVTGVVAGSASITAAWLDHTSNAVPVTVT